MATSGIDDLVAFVAVARTGSFKAAAVQLQRDASVISRRLSHLERRLGVKLLIRTTRNVRLTEAGGLYFQRLRAALDELDTATREVGDFAATPQGTLKVSVPITFGREIVAPLFANIIQNYPKIKIDAHFEDRAVDVVGEGFDAVVRVGILSSSTLISKKLGTFRSLLVTSPAYRDAHGIPDAPEALAHHTCLGFTKYPEWPNWTLEKEGQRVTLQPQCTLIADSSEAIMASALQGLGISLTPDWMVAPHLKAGRLVEVLSGWRSVQDILIHVLMPPGGMVPAKTRIFVDQLSKTFGSEGFRWREYV
jgi:DNA-binding transcriptional LysR family regulator